MFIFNQQNQLAGIFIENKSKNIFIFVFELTWQDGTSTKLIHVGNLNVSLNSQPRFPSWLKTQNATKEKR